jgi:NADPH-dependent ferric siderophore reductase
MSSAKGKIVRFLGDVVLRRARVVAADEVAPGFRRISLHGEGLQPQAGNKLQILLPSDDVRTYTPIAAREGVVLLGWQHAGGPGARWISDVKVGTEVCFVGPQRSLELPAGPVILIGDETSVAVAASFEVSRPGQVHAILQGGSVDALRAAAEAVGLWPAHVSPHGDTTSVVDAVLASQAALPGASIALTGGAEFVLAVRAALRERGVRDIKLKTYWIPGRTGLD